MNIIRTNTTLDVHSEWSQDAYGLVTQQRSMPQLLAKLAADQAFQLVVIGPSAHGFLGNPIQLWEIVIICHWLMVNVVIRSLMMLIDDDF